jgi:hypothetical protein
MSKALKGHWSGVPAPGTGHLRRSFKSGRRPGWSWTKPAIILKGCLRRRQGMGVPGADLADQQIGQGTVTAESQ